MAEDDNTEKAGVSGAFSALATKLIAAAGTTAGVLTVVAATGAAILWARVSALGLPADEALVVLTRQELIAAGAMTLGLFVFLALLAVALVYAIDGRGAASKVMRSGIIVIVAIQIALTPFVVDAGTAVGVRSLHARIGFALLTAIVAAATIYVPRLFSPPAWFGKASSAARGPRRGGGASGATTTTHVQTSSERTTTTTTAAGTTTEVEKTATEERTGTAPSNGRDDGEGERTQRAWERAVAAVAAVVLTVTAFAWFRTHWIIAAAVVLAAALGAISYGIARSSGARFWPYGLAVFFSVLIFGAAFSTAAILRTPVLSPVALVREADGVTSGMVGLLVARSGDRYWIGTASLDCRDGHEGGKTVGLANLGRVTPVPRDEIVDVVIGTPVRLPDADARARALLREILRRQSYAVRAKLRDDVGTVRFARTLDGRAQANTGHRLGTELTTYVRQVRPHAVSPCKKTSKPASPGPGANRPPAPHARVLRGAGQRPSLILDASGTTDDAQGLQYEWRVGGKVAGRRATISVPRPVGRAGTTAHLNVRDAAGATRSTTVKLFPVQAQVFASDSAALDRRGRARLDEIAKGLKGARTVLVEGHADARSTERYNVDLALRRARVVAARLERALPVGRVRPPRSLGEMAPVASNETAEGRRRNRRVEVIGIW